MRIIGFSSAATPSSFLIQSAQALAPCMNRIKRSLGHWVKQAAQGDSDARRHARSSVSSLPREASHEAVFTGPVRPDSTAVKTPPLRVVRESDSALGAECAGRMVISGRMADVCAELERMALRTASAQDACAATRP